MRLTWFVVLFLSSILRISDGIDVIADADAPSCYFDGSLQSKTVYRSSCKALNASQRWELVRDASSSSPVTIASKASGLCWTASNPGTTSASSLLQSACDPARPVTSGQLFALVFTGMVPGCPPESGAGAYQVQALLPDASRRCLTQPRSSAAPQFAPCSGSPVDATQTFLIWTGPRPVAVYTDRYGLPRTGVNGKEKTITPQLLASKMFGQVGQYQVVGAVYAHPLVAPNVRIRDDVSVSGVVIATQQNYVYFFDADQVTNNATPVWRRGPLGIPVTPEDVGLPGEICDDIQPIIGITSTPVIDPTTNTLYVVAKSKATNATITGLPFSSNHTLYSLDLVSGADKYPPMIIAGNSTLNGETVSFMPTFQNQRAGLALTNGHVIVAFGAHCDFNNYTGWVFALQPALQKVTGIWRSVKQSGSDGGGIWASGTAPMVDPDGYIYVTVRAGQPLLTGNGLNLPQVGYYGNAVVKLTQPPGNATAIWPVADYFMPADNPQNGDQDFGTGMPTLFTDGSRNLIALGANKGPGWSTWVSRKAGKAWIQDVRNLRQKSTNAVQAINGVGYILSSFLFDPVNRRLWINPETVYPQRRLQGYQLNSSGLFDKPPAALGLAQAGRSGTPSLTHDNGGGAILWTVGAYGLRAYDASATGVISPVFTDNASFPAVKFQNFVVANGLGYLAGENGVTIYGVTN